ncbi:MAG TPA: peptidoglycan recognition family protein [Actinomycetota bacterium]|nr:peptidoglycan recognition family protein [Actinomycetota bacterium]
MIPFFVPLVPPVEVAPVPPPRIVQKAIPYGKQRKKQMAGYAFRHYGVRTWQLTDPKVVVLHFTVSSTYQSAWHTFANNAPAPGPAGSKPERPGGCTQFIVDKDGTIYQLVPLGTMCRHAIGINHRSVGIEFVEETSARNILARSKQRRAGLRLVRWLQWELGISTANVLGHATVNASPYFQERVAGWRNDHTDWRAPQVRRFRSLL